MNPDTEQAVIRYSVLKQFKLSKQGMNRMNIMAIDPGAGGGIAWLSEGEIRAVPMPEGMTWQGDAMRSICAEGKINVAYMERVGGYVPGNSGPASVKFARHCGNIEAILFMLCVPTVQVAPQTWMKTMGALPKEKSDRKRAIKEVVSRRFPHLSVTLKTADALGILIHAMEGKNK